jgi:hypothetical protein
MEDRVHQSRNTSRVRHCAAVSAPNCRTWVRLIGAQVQATTAVDEWVPNSGNYGTQSSEAPAGVSPSFCSSLLRRKQSSAPSWCSAVAGCTLRSWESLRYALRPADWTPEESVAMLKEVRAMLTSPDLNSVSPQYTPRASATVPQLHPSLAAQEHDVGSQAWTGYLGGIGERSVCAAVR